ncbi:MAG: hypothetical protein KAX31_01680, partial [Thermoplasmata archaeon]|nr:hypothetical protein [Thermoplasmata archaeon]
MELCVGPKKILAYTQYVDSMPPMAPEYENVLAALDDRVGECYTLDELTSYNNLDSMLPGHDVFLIPEPVDATREMLEIIGFLWKDTLQDFLNNGGIVVHCDGSDKYGILTDANLMDISLGGSCSGYSVNVVAPDDPVAEGVSSPYTAQSNSRYYTYNTDDGGTVVMERTGYQEDEAVVIHKQFGQGHVIMIGHDYYLTNDAQDLIVGNAVFNIDDMVVEPAEGFSSVGDEEGPFTPRQKFYTLANNGPEEIEWEASITCDTPENWLTVEPNSGILSPDGNETVVVSLTDDANDLWPGTYSCDVVFRNLDSGNGQVRKVSLQVINVLGEIEVTDSVGDPCDLNMPFGNVIVGLTRTE